MPDPSLPRPAAAAPVRLGELTDRHAGARLRAAADAGVTVTGITASSGAVRPGDLFAAVPGQSGHGARFAPDALRAGAVAVLTDPAGAARLDPAVPVLLADDVRAAMGPVAAEVYGRPSGRLSVLGVTGTSGKTTTTFLIRAGLRAVGRECGLVGTVATMIGDESLKTGFTTPEAPDLQALLAVMAERGVTDVAMEVSSHALTMGRTNGVRFAVGAFTNLSEDHLDFHPTMYDYFDAKLQLFDRSDRAVVVVDDVWGERAAKIAGPCVTVGSANHWASPPTWHATDVVDEPDGSTRFRVHGPGLRLDAGCAIPGRYNVANALLALAVLHESGVDVHAAAPAIAAASVPGRMERIRAGQPFLAVVDYSHKPAAVDNALAALRPLTTGRLIVVLGCGGDRDRGKRPQMGLVAARDADVLIVTDDNPRSEDPAAIRAAMIAGARQVPVEHRAEIREIGRRADAIAAAAALAGPGDTVLVAGKGHETGQEVAGVVVPFDDRDVLRAALGALTQAAR